jgi:hypothetical protein
MAEFEVAAGTKENFTAHLSKCFDPILKEFFKNHLEFFSN